MLLLAVNDFPPILGGEATLYHALARHLGRDEAVVLAPRRAGAAEIDARLSVEVVRRWIPEHGGTVRRMTRGLVGGIHLLALMLRRRFDYLVCGQLLSIGAPMTLLARLTRVPYAVFVHGADLYDYAGSPPWRLLARTIIGGAHTVLTNSRFTAGLVDRILPGVARRLIVLPMGVDPAPRVDPSRVDALRARYDLGTAPVLLSVSRLIPMKGHDVVIEALGGLVKRFPDLVYLIVGDGPERTVLQEKVRALALERHVRFAGRVPASELAAHYELGTMFVQLSRATGEYDGLEGFGLTFLEAASHGLVSVGGRSGGVPEAIADGTSGVLLDSITAPAFAEAVSRILSDPAERGRLSEGARRWAASHPWEAAARCLVSVAGGGSGSTAAEMRRAG